MNLASSHLPGIYLSILACLTAPSRISVTATLSKSSCSHRQIYYFSTPNIPTVIATLQMKGPCRWLSVITVHDFPSFKCVPILVMYYIVVLNLR